MIVTGVTAQDVRDIVTKLNAVGYAGNINLMELETLSGSGMRHRVKLGTLDSKAHGSRQASSGRHGKWLCWHGFRDVIRAIMTVNPDARVATGKAVYKGSSGFEATYPDTADQNVGSMVQPAYMPELCVGTCSGDWE